ncbi:MAG: tetratricopeptide repeat protein [Candidatus Kapaibacterium sp.]|jgi:tetratricopeptide (TPR) repeat protein
MKKSEKKFENLFKQGKLLEAQDYLHEWLTEKPNSVWILSHIAHIYWCLKEYDKALSYSSRALALDHVEPLVLWYHALILESLGFVNQAFNIWGFLVARQAEVIGEIDCGEGVDWAKSLQVDCLFKMSSLTCELGELQESMHYFRRMKYRINKGSKGIYSDDDIKNLQKRIKEKECISPNNKK